VDETARITESDRVASLGAELRERATVIERLERELDAMRADVAVRDGYAADLLARLAEAEERARSAERAGEVARRRLASIATAAYTGAAVEEEAVRARVAAAILRVSDLKDRERAQALRAFLALREP
jgi:hypothetical protein